MAAAAQEKLTALGAARDMWPSPPRLRPHDIPVLTLDGTLTADALQQLLCHKACAVHVRGFIDNELCAEIATRLAVRDTSSSQLFSNWNIHQNAAASSDSASESYAVTEVDKIGITSGEALESMENLAAYLDPSSPMALDTLLPGDLNPFSTLRSALATLHPEGCRRSKLRGWEMPVGTFRRMYTSRGLIHADT